MAAGFLAGAGAAAGGIPAGSGPDKGGIKLAVGGAAARGEAGATA